MPPAKNYAFLLSLSLSHRRWECEPKARRPRIKFRLLASFAVFYRPDLSQAPQRREEGRGWGGGAMGLGKSLSRQAVACQHLLLLHSLASPSSPIGAYDGPSLITASAVHL